MYIYVEPQHGEHGVRILIYWSRKHKIQAAEISMPSSALAQQLQGNN